MAVFLFETLDPRKAGRLPGNSAFAGAGTPFAADIRMFHAIQLFGAKVAY